MAPLIRPSQKTLFAVNSAALAFVQAKLWQMWVEKWSNFRYHGNKGRPNENLNITIKSAVYENPLFGANSAAVVFVQAELWPIRIENCRNFKNQYLKEYLTDIHQTSIRTGP